MKIDEFLKDEKIQTRPQVKTTAWMMMRQRPFLGVWETVMLMLTLVTWCIETMKEKTDMTKEMILQFDVQTMETYQTTE